jgi:hypothetical protein
VAASEWLLLAAICLRAAASCLPLPPACRCCLPASCLLPPALPQAPELEFVQAHGVKAVSFSLPSARPAFSAAAAVAPAGFWAD